MSRCKFDRSREFIPGYKFGGVHWRSVAVQTISEPEIYHGAGFKLRADARVRVQRPLQICLGCRSKSKKCDKQLTHIVRVMGQALLFVSVPENCLGINSSFFWSKVVQQIVMLPEIILLRRGGEKF